MKTALQTVVIIPNWRVFRAQVESFAAKYAEPLERRTIASTGRASNQTRPTLASPPTAAALSLGSVAQTGHVR